MISVNYKEIKDRAYKDNNGHGLKFEDYVIERYGLIKETDKTAPFDAYTKGGSPISIKFSNPKNDLVFSDIFRQARMEAKGFYLVVGLWSESNIIVDEIYIIPIHSSTWRNYFDNDLVDEYEKMLRFTEEHEKQLWDDEKDRIGELWKQQTSNIIRPRFRWQLNDSTGKIERRIQCAMRHNSFREEFIESGKYKFNRQSGGSLIDSGSYEYKETEEEEIVEDTKYGKKITRRKITREYKGKYTVEFLQSLGVPEELYEDEGMINHYKHRAYLEQIGRENRRLNGKG